MFEFIEDLKYGDGIKIKLGSFALTLARNNCGADMPEILEKWYKNRTGKELDLENPLTFNEKICAVTAYIDSRGYIHCASAWGINDTYLWIHS